MSEKVDKWMSWAIKLQSIAQAGITYTTNEFDKDRFYQIRDTAVEIISYCTDIKIEKVREIFGNEAGYQTPKIDVRSVVLNEGKILLVKEKATKLWCLPGGWADCGLTLKENVIKETKEESGFLVEPVRILAIMDRNIHNYPKIPMSIYKIFVESRLIEGAFEANLETEESSFFDFDSLPEVDERKTSRAQIELCFNIINDKAYPYFD
jgi:ADP-ribose pyrophosphatase YjhB (NUDIX family)